MDYHQCEEIMKFQENSIKSNKGTDLVRTKGPSQGV